MPIRYLMLSLLIATPLSVLADSFLSPFINAPKYSWAAGGYSQDVKERDHRGGIISGGLFPRETGFGFQAYLEGTKLNDPKDDGMVYTLGIEPVFKWHWAYIGAGLAVSDRTTAVSGTLWNFSGVLGARYKPKNQKWFLDLGIRHRSHCEACGIASDRINSGMTSLNFQFGLEF